MDQIYVMVPVYNPEGNPQYPWSNAVFFYQFSYDLQNYYPPYTIIEQGYGYIPNACLALDGDGQVYGVWEKYHPSTGYMNVRSRYRDMNGVWWPALTDTSENVSDQDPPYPRRNSYTPFIETWPTYAYCVWSREEIDWEPTSRDIWRRQKFLPFQSWLELHPYSNPDDYLASECPTNASGDCSVWSQPDFMDPNYDIWYRSDLYGGPFNLTRSFFIDERYGHSQLDRIGDPWLLYATFTKENTIPYRIITCCQPLSGNFGEAGLYYTVNTGETKPSSFCLKRDNFIRYQNYAVDYGKDEVAYNLHYLDPHHIYGYRLKATLYFEGSGVRELKVLIDGAEYGLIRLIAGQPYTFEVEIPRLLYLTDRRITLSVKNESDSGVYVAGLKIYLNKPGRVASGGSGGIQGAEVQNREGGLILSVSPNPASNNVVVNYSVAQPAKVKIQVFDIMGRITRTLIDNHVEKGIHHLIWNRRDNLGHQISSGIYFIRLETDKIKRTEKVLILR